MNVFYFNLKNRIANWVEIVIFADYSVKSLSYFDIGTKSENFCTWNIINIR